LNISPVGLHCSLCEVKGYSSLVECVAAFIDIGKTFFRVKTSSFTSLPVGIRGGKLWAGFLLLQYLCPLRLCVPLYQSIVAVVVRQVAQTNSCPSAVWMLV
uniref:Uncharacterized protein n=1 Tax=Sander lucioperca TaxID=283035 RepID=A0A8D0D661_SANLU